MSQTEHRDFFFVQMADPQFGMFAFNSGMSHEEAQELYRKKGLKVRPVPRITGFADETRLYGEAIAVANRLSPDFVVMCGDMTDDSGNPDQFAELMRITDKLDDSIPLNWVSGNHDIGNDLTEESLALYRERYGEDNYFFDHRGSRFIVIDSNVVFYEDSLPYEWKRLSAFLEGALKEGRSNGSAHIVVFTHHPLFLQDPDEEDTFLNIPRRRRRVLIDLFKAYGVRAIFSGHSHRNHHASDGGLEMVTTGAVGYPLGDDPSGFRIVKVYGDRLEHEYFGFDAMPDEVRV